MAINTFENKPNTQRTHAIGIVSLTVQFDRFGFSSFSTYKQHVFLLGYFQSS